MTNIVIAYVVMANITMAYIVRACMVVAYIVMAYTVTVCIAMAYIATAQGRIKPEAQWTGFRCFDGFDGLGVVDHCLHSLRHGHRLGRRRGC